MLVISVHYSLLYISSISATHHSDISPSIPSLSFLSHHSITSGLKFETHLTNSEVPKSFHLREKKKMATIGILAICLSCSLCLYFVLALIRQLNKLWWTPIRIQHQMHSQGINGPPYKFFYGSNKDVSNMKKEAMVKPMDLSHDILYKAQPHIHAWIKEYGKTKKKEKKNPSLLY